MATVTSSTAPQPATRNALLQHAPDPGKGGFEKILDFKLSDAEQAEFNKSADAVRAMNKVLSDTGVI